MAKDRPTGGYRFKKRVPIIKLPFGLGDIKVNLSASHLVESVTLQGRLGKLQSNINYNLHKNTVQGLTLYLALVYQSSTHCERPKTI